MKTKPLLIKILMYAFFIEPMIKILYFKAATHFDFATILENLMTRTSPREIFDFWLVFPLAGLMLVRLRQWSYYAFLTFMLYIVFSIFTYEKYTWPYFSDSPLTYHYIMVILSLGAFAYLLFPRVREPFFNRRLRWWETRTRYQTQMSAKVMGSKVTFHTDIVNISLSGAFLKDNGNLDPGQDLTLEFSNAGVTVNIPVKVMSKHMIGDQMGYGVEFTPRNFKQRFELHKLVRTLK